MLTWNRGVLLCSLGIEGFYCAHLEQGFYCAHLEQRGSTVLTGAHLEQRLVLTAARLEQCIQREAMGAQASTPPPPLVAV